MSSDCHLDRRDGARLSSGRRGANACFDAAQGTTRPARVEISRDQPKRGRVVFSLAGKKALVVGIANEDSIAFGCAKAFRAQGADLAVTYQNEKAEPFVRPIADKLET